MKLKEHSRELKFLGEFMEFSAKTIFKGKELANVVLTLKPQRGSYGYCTVQEIFTDDEFNYLEISYNIDYLNRPLKEIFSTLIHEQIHAYCRKAEIKEVSANNRYHNNKFKELCDEIGLECEKHKGIGWNTNGKMSEELSNHIDEEFLSKYDSKYIEELFHLKNKLGTTEAKRKGPDRNAKRYICPCCGSKARAKAGALLICGSCFQDTGEITYMEEQ